MRIPAVGEVLDYARRLGFRRTVYRGAYVMVNQAFPLTIFDCVQLRPEDVNTALVDSADRYECRFLEPDEIERFAVDLDRVSARVAREALARGDACYAVLDGGSLANLSCFAPRPTPLLNDLVVHFDPPRWYMYGAFTPPPYRGRRLHALGVLGGSLALFDQGVPSLVGVYERTNYASMVSALRMGWKRCGGLYRVGIGSWMRHGRTAEAKAAGMRLEGRLMESRA
jgi:hypothetical protein